MKKNLAFVLVLVLLTLSGLSIGKVWATTPTDTPEDEGGDGFLTTDPCGYVMGVADTLGFSAYSGTVKFSTQGNNVQGCFDADGNAYANNSSSPTRDSRATYVYHSASLSANYTLDFVGSGYQVQIDQSTHHWTGYAKITDASYTGTSRWVWFDWACDTSSGDYCVQTDPATGDVSGYAWNDDLGYLQFTGLSQELPHQDVDMDVDVLSSDGTSYPEDVTAADAPIADGYDYWRVRVSLYDSSANSLSASDVTSLTITPTNTGTVYLDQVEDTGDAITESTSGTMMKDPSTGTWSTCGTSGSCVLTETSGSTSWNLFIRSASPTSNMIGLQNDSDTTIDSLGDREGCRWIYYDQWHNVDGKTAQEKCPNSGGSYYTKAAVFYDRVNDRNQYILESLNIDVTFAAGNTSISTGAGTNITQVDSDTYTYTPTTGESLSWRPRYQLTDFSALYGGSEHDEISSDTATYTTSNMTLKTTATVSETSDAFFHALAMRRPGYAVKYQLEVDKGSGWDQTNGDLELIVDTASDGTADCTRRTDTVAKGYGSSGVSYAGNYAMKYGQKSTTTCGGVGGTPHNTVSSPTAEQWVCDNLRGDVTGQNPQLSCYFTGYMTRIDSHDDPEAMLVIGAINASISQGDVLDNNDSISMVGAGADTIKLRNKMYAQIVRYTLGQTASISQSQANIVDGEDDSGVMLPLLDGRLLYTEGDIIVDGASSFSDKTIVTVGGNVIFSGNGTDHGNVTGGRLGVIAFKDSDGNGGNVYVAPGVTEIYANIFIDGALLSYDGATVPTHSSEFTWPDTETRLSTLLNQLYLNGSLVSHNTVNAAPESSYSTSGSWDLGDGTTTSNYSKAREHDLNMLRQYRRCFELNPDGTLSSTVIDCNEGEQLSTYGDTNGLYNSFILDYTPPYELPIFRAQSGLFQ